jgi:hypothetical protein
MTFLSLEVKKFSAFLITTSTVGIVISEKFSPLKYEQLLFFLNFTI